LEHFISERLEDRIATKLGDPDTDPHGHSIPARNGTLRSRQEVPLLSWACGVPAVISSVSDRDPAVLREIERLGLLPGISVRVELGKRGASLRVKIGADAEALRLSGKLVDAISVVAAAASPESR
jgi:DtxR family Mn-dependent transcriptional regulator